MVVSCAQFRPEKDHAWQLKIWKEAQKDLPEGAKLYMLGGTRGPEDVQLLTNLKQMAVDLGVQSSVNFVVSQPRKEWLKIFAKAKMGIHTMKEEHFGISIVEMMSAGLVTVAHASGGPLHDIIGKSEEKVGFLAKTTEDFAKFLVRGLTKFD